MAKAQTRIQSPDRSGKTPGPRIASAEQTPAVSQPPRITIGRTVNYVLKDGQVRPFLIVRVWGDNPFPGNVNGVLIFDGSNDAHVLPNAEMNPHHNPAGNPQVWLTSVHYDANKAPFTWHWPERV